MLSTRRLWPGRNIVTFDTRAIISSSMAEASMELDPYSQAIVNAINASGVVPFHRFHPVAARAEILKLRMRT